MAKKKGNDRKWLQVGGFLLGMEKNSAGSWLVCKSVSGQWSLRWREDSTMYVMMMCLIRRGAEDDTVREYIHSLVTVFFIATSYTHDLTALATKGEMPFSEGVARLLKEQNDYETSLMEKPTDEEENEALEEVGRMQQISEELDKLDEDEDTEKD